MDEIYLLASSIFFLSDNGIKMIILLIYLRYPHIIIILNKRELPLDDEGYIHKMSFFVSFFLFLNLVAKAEFYKECSKFITYV